MKKILIRSDKDYQKVIDFIKNNQTKVSDVAREELLLFPERNEYAMVVAYDAETNRFFAGEYDLKYQIVEWAGSIESLLLPPRPTTK